MVRLGVVVGWLVQICHVALGWAMGAVAGELAQTFELRPAHEVAEDEHRQA